MNYLDKIPKLIIKIWKSLTLGIVCLAIFMAITWVASSLRKSPKVFASRLNNERIIPANRYSTRRDVVENLHKSFEKGDFKTAALLNSILAREAFLRAHKTLKAWEGMRDPETGLVPKYARSKEKFFWNAKDTAADLFPFLLLAGYYLDRDSEHLWLLALGAERRICGAMPCNIFFQPTKVETEDMPEVIFGASEYAKDGLIAITERLGRGPWFIRLEEVAEELIKASYISTSLGNIPSSNTEVNGNMLQVLTRLYWATQKEEYLRMAERIGDVYFFEILPKSDYLPACDWNFKDEKPARSYFHLRDHGNEIIPGLVELYALEKLQGRPKAELYREPLKKFLDNILKLERTEDGLWYDDVDINTYKARNNKKMVVDSWGYILNAYQTFDLVEGTSVYQDEIQRVMRAAAARKSFIWQRSATIYDGYADAIESMLYLLPWFNIAECRYWVDDEIEVMFHMQAPSGFIGEGYLDGNFIRTALLYGTYKTMGIIADPWREDLFLGAVYDKNKKELYIYLTADKPWKGVLKFDLPRHRNVWKLPFEFPRLNETPEWFVVEAEKKYSINGLLKDKSVSFTGESLAQGLLVTIDKENISVSLKVSEE